MKNPFNICTASKAAFIVAGVAVISGLPLASAAEVQIFSNEQRQENGNTLILDNDNTGGNVSLQFGSSLNEKLEWDSANTQFIFTDDVNVQGNLDVDGTLTTGSGNIQLTDATGLINGENIANGTIDDDSIDFGTGADQVGADDLAVTDNFTNSDATNVQGALEDLDTQLSSTASSLGSSTGTTSNSYVLDTDNSGGNVSLQFGTTLNESIYWNNAASRFEFSDDIYVNGNIDLTGTVDGVDVSGLNTTVGTLGSDLTTLNSTVSGINSTVTTLGSDLTALEGDVTTLGSTVSGIDADVTTLESSVTTLNSTVATQGTDIATLDSRVDANDTAISNINTTLGGNTVQSIAVSMNDLTVAADGTNNLADIYTDFDAAANHQYYLIKSQQASQQDIDLKFKVKLPTDFVDFSNSNDFNLFYKNTGSASDSKLDITVEDEDGDDAFAISNLNSSSWTNYADELDGAQFDPAAGEYIYVTVKGYARNNSGTKSPYIGEMSINYNSKDVWSSN